MYEIKVDEDPVVVIAGDGRFYWPIPHELDEAELIYADAGVSTPSSSGPVEIQIAHHVGGAGGGGTDVLTTKISIAAGNYGATPGVIAGGAYGPVSSTGTAKDWLRIDVDAAGVGAKGLAVMVGFTPSPLGSVAVQGAKGDPGGITDFTGPFPGGPGAAGTPGGAGSAWVTSTAYETGDVVLSGGTYYVATADHTSSAATEPGVGVDWETVWTELVYTEGQVVTNGGTTYVAIETHIATTANEPGVGVDWEDFWMVLIASSLFAAIPTFINGNGYVLDTGLKSWVHVPFDCEIVEVTLLADVAGSIVIDIWKDTYGNFPPTNADSITAASPPTLVGAFQTQDTTLTGWTTTINAGDILAFNIDSCSAIRKILCSLRVERT